MSNRTNALFTERSTGIALCEAAITCFSGFKSFVIHTPRSFSSRVSIKILFSFSVLIVYSNFGLFLPMCMTLHLSTLKLSSHSLVHWLSVSKSFCKMLQSSIDFTVLNNFVSSANIFILQLTISGMSFTYIRNRIGPNTDPCGTPLITSTHSEYSPRTIILILLSDRKSSIQHSTLPSIPYAESFCNNLFFGTLSKAFWKSKKITSTLYPLSTSSVQLSNVSSKFVKQDLPFVKPCCAVVHKSFYNKCRTMASLIIDSIILHGYLL